MQQELFKQPLGFKADQTPCAATFFNIFSRLDNQEVEQKLGIWAAALQQQSPPEAAGEAIAIAGKRLRGAKNQGAPAAHLLSACGHRLGLTLLQVAVGDKTNEITAIQELLRGLVLQDKLIPVDALLTQREVAQTILDQGGDYVMVVRENQPSLLAQVAGAIAGVDFYTQALQTAKTVDSGHGRSAERAIIATAALADCDLWPGLDQAFKLARRSIEKRAAKRETRPSMGSAV